MPPYSLQGKTLFITGGASGIGAEVARQASAKGANLALVDVDGDAAERMAASLPGAIGIIADVRDYESLERAVNETVARFGGIDVAFANAGIETAHTARAIPLVEMERIADINFTGVFRTVRAALPYVIDRRGYVLITASLAAILHAPPLSHYAGTKAGVEAFGNACGWRSATRASTSASPTSASSTPRWCSAASPTRSSPASSRRTART